MKKLKLLDTFSGIGGFSYAAEKLVGGYETTQFVENDPYCQKVLNKHWPNVPIHDDIETYRAELYSADVICGGFPCQDISTAGQGKGITQESRSGKFYDLMRVICMVRPKYVILENVAAILANGLDVVLGELSKGGYNAEWSTFRASDTVQACHRRDRWWLVAYPNSKQSSGTKSQIQTGWNSLESSNRSGNVANPKSIRVEGMWSSGQQIKLKVEETRLSQWGNKRRLLSPNWRSYTSEPCLRRGDDGLRNRVDRLKALGNAVVPQVAAIPLQRVKTLHESLTTVDD